MEKKGLWLARLASERAGLWLALMGLDEQTITQQPVAGEWTAKDTVAHLAEWDAFRGNQLRVALAGQANALQRRPSSDDVNAATFVERRDWSLVRVVAEARRARAELLALVEPLSWPQLQMSFDVGMDRPYIVIEWIERRARHDQMHSLPIHDWRRNSGIEGGAGPKVVLEAALDDQRAELLAWASLIPDTERSIRRVCGEWTLQEMLGHLADWEWYGVDCLRKLAAGQTEGLGYAGDFEPWNQDHASARMGQSWETTWSDFTGARAALLELLATYDDARLARTIPTAWKATDHPYTFFTIGAGHDWEHAVVLRRELDPQAPAD